MAAHPRSHSFSVLFLFLSLILFPSAGSDSPPTEDTVYEILSKFGLPSGLLPSSVRSYTLGDDGAFVVDLDKPCYVQFDYLVYYDTSISGKLRYGSITDLKGIQVQRLFLWLGVGEIRVDLPPSDSIYFQVGVINKKLDIDQFKTVRACRGSATVSCATSLTRLFKLYCVSLDALIWHTPKMLILGLISAFVLGTAATPSEGGNPNVVNRIDFLVMPACFCWLCF